MMAPCLSPRPAATRLRRASRGVRRWPPGEANAAVATVTAAEIADRAIAAAEGIEAIGGRMMVVVAGRQGEPAGSGIAWKGTFAHAVTPVSAATGRTRSTLKGPQLTVS